MSPNVTLMVLCLAASCEHDVTRALERAAERPDPALAELVALWRKTPGLFAMIRQIAATVDHDASHPDPAGFAAGFDRLAGLFPEAGVALYSLGDPALLAAATDEVAGRMREWGLLGGDKRALEIGCGNGRFLKALAGDLGQVTGLDVSPAMVAAAQERCRHLPNAEARHTEGRDLRHAADASLDLVFAVDSFPYIVLCGDALARTHIEEAARVLKPGGHLLILNYAYRGSLDDHRAAIAAHAERTGFAVLRSGTRDLRLWDGAAFLLRKA